MLRQERALVWCTGERAMYEAYYGLREKPFSIAPNPQYLFPSRRHRRALALLEYGLLNQVGFCVITGAIGSGKTTLVRKLLQEVGADQTVGVVTHTQCESFQEMLRWILLSFRLDYAGKDKVELYQTLSEFLEAQNQDGKRTVLIVDEAQHLGAEALEQLRMLSNVNSEQQLLQMILVGQPDLWHLLRSPQLEQFAQRIGVDYYLEPLEEEDTAGYIRHRLAVAGGSPDIFTEATYPSIWRYSKGIPRLINLLCDMALVYGYADQVSRIDPRVIEEVIRDKEKGLMPLGEREPRNSGEFHDSTNFGW